MGDRRPSNRRVVLPENSRAVLKTWFSIHKSNPYPTTLEKHNLAEMAGISAAQVNNWFAYTRRQARLDKYPSAAFNITQDKKNIVSPTSVELTQRPCRKMFAHNPAPNVQVATVSPLSFTQQTKTIDNDSTIKTHVISCTLSCCVTSQKATRTTTESVNTTKPQPVPTSSSSTCPVISSSGSSTVNLLEKQNSTPPPKVTPFPVSSTVPTSFSPTCHTGNLSDRTETVPPPNVTLFSPSSEGVATRHQSDPASFSSSCPVTKSSGTNTLNLSDYWKNTVPAPNVTLFPISPRIPEYHTYGNFAHPNNAAGQYLHQDVTQQFQHYDPTQSYSNYHPCTHWSSAGQPHLSPAYNVTSNYNGGQYNVPSGYNVPLVIQPDFSTDFNQQAWKPPGIETFLQSNPMEKPHYQTDTPSNYQPSYQRTCTYNASNGSQYPNLPQKYPAELSKETFNLNQGVSSKNFSEPLYIDTTLNYSHWFDHYNPLEAPETPDSSQTSSETAQQYRYWSPIIQDTSTGSFGQRTESPLHQNTTESSTTNIGVLESAREKPQQTANLTKSRHLSFDQQSSVGAPLVLNTEISASMPRQFPPNVTMYDPSSAGQDCNDGEFSENSSSSSAWDRGCPKNTFRPIKSPIMREALATVNPPSNVSVSLSSDKTLTSFPSNVLSTQQSQRSYDVEAIIPALSETGSSVHSPEFAWTLPTQMTTQMTTTNDQSCAMSTSVKTSSQSLAQSLMASETDFSSSDSTDSTMTVESKSDRPASTPDLVRPLILAHCSPFAQLTTELTTTNTKPPTTSASSSPRLPTLDHSFDDITFNMEDEDEAETLTRKVEAAQALVDLQVSYTSWQTPTKETQRRD